MSTSRIIYILISIIALAIIAVVVFLRRKTEPKPLSTLAALAFLLIIAGIFFGDNQLISYSFFGAGVILAFIDIVKKSKK
ncbi:hypothetical protein ES703_54980 [subsurface metagenome]